MTCPRCQHENPPQSKFCFDCGARLALTCASCRTEIPAGVKFCNQCGQPVAGSPSPQPRFSSPERYTPKHLAQKILASKAALEGERKQVTVLFADLKGSMELLADRDPEDARKLLDPVLEQMMGAVHRYEGTVNQVMGDGIMALFGAPLAHEDHAVRACYTALRMQEAIRRHSEDLRRAHGIEVQVRVGINSGEVVVRTLDLEIAAEYYRQALVLAGELGMRPLVAHCHVGLGNLYRHTGRREQAGQHHGTARAMLREMGMRFWLAQLEPDPTESA